MEKEWFSSWFDSPYYHILYKSHDEQDAKLALDGLLKALNLAPGSRILDLACGKGRHARYLAEKGFDVTGLDISASSITFARQFEHESLSFYQHDMRLPFRVNYYDAVVNFFTSFGYFDNDRDHLVTLLNVQRNLKPGGLFLLDFFNAVWVRNHLVHSEVKEIDGIKFHISKLARGHFVYKKVEFDTGGRHFVFRERVRLFSLPELSKLFEQAGLQVRSVLGGYDLSPFDEMASKRLILLAEKGG
jgi:SAM-dependent methyltransferase